MLEIAGLPDRYSLKKKLGAGGIAVVYLAFDKKRGVDVALKKLQAEVTSQFGNAFDRFKREFALLASLSHSNLIKTYELDQTANGEPFITMEYIEGVPLSELIARGTLTFAEKISITLQVAQALAFIHSKGVIHRDIKPSNIIVQDGLHVKLLDFGLSRYIEEENNLTLSSELIGSPHYVSPEYINRNFQKEPADHRTDIYSFGATIFELFAGKPPFNYQLSWQVLGAHLYNKPPLLREFQKDLPAWLERMINICLNKKSAERYQRMDQIVDLIENREKGFRFSDLFFGRYQLAHLGESWRDLKDRYGRVVTQVFFSLIVASIATYTWGTTLGIKFDQLQLREIFAIRGAIPPPADISIVAINNTTFVDLDLSPRQPLPRRYFAEALERIVAAKPRLIVLDLVGFKESDDEEANQRIERALRGPIPITIGKGLRRPDESVALGDSRFRKAATMELSMLVNSEADTVWRLGLKSNPVGDVDPEYPIREPLVRFAGLKSRRPESGSLINFYGSSGQIPSYSLSKFIGKTDEALLLNIRDRIVFIGVHDLSSQGKGLIESDRDDFSVTASSSPMFGVEIHATIAANLMDQSWIRRNDIETEARSLFCIFFVISLLLFALPFIWGILAVGLALTGWAILSYFAVVKWSLFLPGFLYSSFVLAILIFPLTIAHYFMGRRKMHDLQTAFGVIEQEQGRGK